MRPHNPNTPPPLASIRFAAIQLLKIIAMAFAPHTHTHTTFGAWCILY